MCVLKKTPRKPFLSGEGGGGGGCYVVATTTYSAVAAPPLRRARTSLNPQSPILIRSLIYLLSFTHSLTKCIIAEVAKLLLNIFLGLNKAFDDSVKSMKRR
jgi:hypothetical protein